MSRTTGPLTLEIAIQDDGTADVVSPTTGHVVTTLSANSDSTITEAVGEYASGLAQRQVREVLAKITRGEDSTVVRVPADGSPPERVDLRTGDTTTLTQVADAATDVERDLIEAQAQELHGADDTATEAFEAMPPIVDAPESDNVISHRVDSAPETSAGPILVSTDDRGAPSTEDLVIDDLDTIDDDLEPPDAAPVPRTRNRRPANTSRRRPAGAYVPNPQSTRQRISATLHRVGTVLRRHRTPLLILGIAAVVCAAAAGILFGAVLGPGDDRPTMPPAAATPAVTQDPTSDEVECPTKTEGDVSTGRGPGNQSSGVAVIKAFNWAYYQWRNAQAARSMVSANGKVGSVLDMQASIDVLTPGLRYCLAITSTGNDTYNVQISEIPPTAGASPRVIRQVVHTQNIDGRYWITEFARPATTT